MSSTDFTNKPTNSPNIVDNQVAVVTGGGQGIGAAFAKHLAGLGYTVVVLDVNSEKAGAVAASLQGASTSFQVDITDERAVATCRDRTLERFGRVDVLVNCAAIFSTIQMSNYDEISIADWDKVMSVNVAGTFLCCREFSQPMKGAERGRIVNMSSGTVYKGHPHYLHYVASKAAIIGLTRALSKELGEFGVTVNALAPGSTETEVPRRPVNVEAVLASQAIKRRQKPDDLFSALTFLTDPASSFVTGQTIIVDGGASFT